MVIEMRIDDDNNVVSSKAHEAVILVKENLAYEDTLEDTRWEGMFKLGRFVARRRTPIEHSEWGTTTTNPWREYAID